MAPLPFHLRPVSPPEIWRLPMQHRERKKTTSLKKGRSEKPQRPFSTSRADHCLSAWAGGGGGEEERDIGATGTWCMGRGLHRGLVWYATARARHSRPDGRGRAPFLSMFPYFRKSSMFPRVWDPRGSLSLQEQLAAALASSCSQSTKVSSLPPHPPLPLST